MAAAVSVGPDVGVQVCVAVRVGVGVPVPVAVPVAEAPGVCVFVGVPSVVGRPQRTLSSGRPAAFQSPVSEDTKYLPL